MHWIEYCSLRPVADLQGPDNLTPALTVPPPATVVAALKSGLHAPPRGAPISPAAGAAPGHASASPAPGSAAASAASAAAASSPAQPLPSPAGGASSTSLLQNLLRKGGATPAPVPPSPAAAAQAAGATPAAHTSAAPAPGATAHAPPPPSHSWGRGSVSMSGNTAGVGSSSGLGNSASGAALDAASTSAFILPGQQQQEPLHMAGSKSAGSLVDPAPAPGVSGSGLMLPAGLGSPGGAASLLAATSAKERITDKASTALNRLTTKVSNLLTPTKDAAGSPGAGGGGLSSAGSLSTSPAAGGGMSLLSRLRQSSSGQAGLLTPQPAPHPAPGAPPPPPPPPPVPYTAYGEAHAARTTEPWVAYPQASC